MIERKLTKGQRKSIRRRLFEWNPHCHWCGELMLITVDAQPDGKPHPLFATIEHLKPLADGGTDEIENLYLAHHKCNR